MQLGGLQKLTLIDYPGRLAATVFLCGCNFRCPFCYSPELVLPEKIKNQPRIPEKDFFDFLKERRGLLEGVVICGGEPTIHEDLPDFSEKIKKLGYLVKLDTNGSNPEILKKLINEKLIDYVAMDIKAPKEKYEFFSGSKLIKEGEENKFSSSPTERAKLSEGGKERIFFDFAVAREVEKSINILKNGKVDYEFRTTVAPGLKKEDILNLADWIAGRSVNYFLQEFNSQKEVLNPEILSSPILKREEIEEVVEKIKPKFKTCQLR